MQRGRSSRFYIVVLVAAACVLALGLNGWRSWQSREAALGGDKVETANLARSLAQHAQDNLETADAVVLGLRERIEASGLQDINRTALYTLMSDYVRQLPMLAGLFVYSADGDWIVDSKSPFPSSTLNNADRAYFRFHQGNADRGSQVGNPIRSRSGGEWVLPVSVRLDGPNGQFAGVVLATVSVPQIQSFYQTFDAGSGGAIGLFTSSGILVARNPPDDKLVGSDVSHGQVFAHIKQGTKPQSFTSTSA
jgi:two-component system sensor histidine kinase/response regulator